MIKLEIIDTTELNDADVYFFRVLLLCIYIVNCVFIKLHCKIYYKRLKENDFVEERMKLYFVIRNTVLLFRNYTKV